MENDHDKQSKQADRRGFEIPNVSTESGGVVLLRVKGMFAGLDQDRAEPGEVFIRLQMDLQ